MQSNVILELQGRQWRQVEGWSVKKLSQFAEERALLGLRKSWCCRSVVKNKQSTLALAFSCDGSLLASSHLTHEILIHRTRPCLGLLRVLLAHPSTHRSPWCLTFHPSHPHHLLAGCLGGSVLLWDVQAGKCLFVWRSGISSPINSLVYLPTHPDHFLVACDTRLKLLHHCGDQLVTVWTAKTATVDLKVRLVLHHPESTRIVTAVTNVTHHQYESLPNIVRIPQKSSYRLQMYPYGFDRGPDLENSSMGLISMAVRVLSPHSVVLTSHFVISSSVETSGTKLCIHSTRRNSFGHCLFSTMLTPKHMGVVSLDLSACQRFLLLASSGKQFLYHMESHHSCLKVFQVEERKSSLNLELCCEMRGVYSANVARWMPLQQTGRVGGVCVGTQQGGVVWWGGGEGGGWGRRGGEGGGTEDITTQCRLEWFKKHD